MERRNFLGSVLGLIVGGPLVYVTKAEFLIPDKITIAERIVRAFRSRKLQLLRYRIGFYCTESKEPIWAPKIEDVIIGEEIKFICMPMLMKTSLQIHSVIVINDELNFVAKSGLSVSLNNGDTLKLSYTLRLEFNNA